ncbi:MAG: DUF1573 domain-containing protein [Cyclobacteriaceae bacterium]|nr:DUF1573 domain-containing protein [Cyclobacteriaceae bacterium]
MKTLLSFLFGIFVVVFASAQTTEETSSEKPGPRIVFGESTFEFGDINQGDQVEHTFKFENTGTEPLILTNVQTTCGCTVPKWPREPILPGQSADIVVKFNSTGKMGKVNKIIKVISNSVEPVTQISITTNILPKSNSGTL